MLADLYCSDATRHEPEGKGRTTAESNMRLHNQTSGDWDTWKIIQYSVV